MVLVSCIQRNPTKGIESLEKECVCRATSQTLRVAFNEIPQRELRGYASSFHYRLKHFIRVAFNEIPQRELRANTGGYLSELFLNMLHSTKSHKGN